jgi:hypothetical protein
MAVGPLASEARTEQMRKLAFGTIAVLMSLMVSSASATVIVTLSDAGVGLTKVSITGTGTTMDDCCGFTTGPVFGAIGDYVQNVPFPDGIISLPTPEPFIGASMLEKIDIRSRDPLGDRWGFRVDGDWGFFTDYDLNIMFDIAIPFSKFNPGSYTDPTDQDNAKLDGFELRVVTMPEPGTLALFGLGLAGLGFARRRAA